MKEKAAKRKGAGELIESLRRQGIDEAVLSAALDEAHVEGVEARGPR
jgi:SOS response regulatory protein OraA/RecX